MTNITISEPQNMPHCHSLCEVAGAQTPHRCRYAEDDYARAHLVRLHTVAVEFDFAHPTVAGRHCGSPDGAAGRDEVERTSHCDGRSTVSNRMRPHFAHGDGTGMGSSAFVKSPQLEHIHVRLRSR